MVSARQPMASTALSQPPLNCYLSSESQAIHVITFFRGSKPMGTETHRAALDIAKARAIAAVESGRADRAEVRDLKKRLVFHYPRTFSA